MKKLRVLVLLLLALVMVISACGKAGGDDAKESKAPEAADNADSEQAAELDGTTITVQAETDWMDYYKAAAARVMEANPGTTVELKEVSSFDHLDIIDTTDALNEDVADVFAIPADRLYGLNDNMVLQPLDSDVLAEELGGFEDFEGGLGGNFKIGEDYFAFPFNIETLITYTNKANAEAASLDAEGTFEIADQKNEAAVLLPLFDAWYGVALTNASPFELLGKDENGAFFSDFTKEFSELSKEQQAAFETIYNYWKAHNEAGTVLFDNEAGWGYVDEQFKTGGNGVVRLGGPWDQATMSDLAGEDNLIIAPINKITLNGNALIHWKGGWGLAINARNEEDANKIALSELMIKEIVNPEYAVDLFKATGKVLENVKAETYAESADLTDTQKAIIEATIASYKDAPARPLFTEWGQVWDTWKNGVLSWDAKKPESVEAAYAEIKASFDGMMVNIQ